MTQDEMNSCIFTNTVDRSEDDSPPVCLVELVNSKAKSSENHGPVELCVDKLKKSSHESTSNACVPKDIDDKTASLLPEINDLESETHLAILKLEDNANNGIQVAVSTGPIDLDNAYSSTVKEPNSPKPNDNTTKGVNEMPISGRHSLSDSKQPSCDLNVEDEDDLDLEDRPLTVDTQGVDDISPIESENSVVNVVNNSLLSNISSTITENTQASITTVPEVSEASVSVISTMSLPDLASSSSSFSSSLPTHPNLHPMSASNKSYSSDRHHTSTPVALATVAPIRMSSVGPDYTISNESLRSIKPTPQDVVTSPTMCVHSSIPSSVTKHEVGTVSSSSSVSYSSKSSNQPNTVEVSSFSSPSMTNSISTGTTSIPISITPIIGTCAMNTMNMSSIFSVRGRPAVGQSVLPLLSVGPQPTPSFTSQTSLPSLPSQSGVHFMPFIGSMSATLPVSVGNTSLKNIINPSSGIPIPAGTPAVPCPPLQIFNMTPVPQFVGPPSFVLHPTGPIPCPNSFQFPQASAHLLPAGGGGLGGTAFNFLQPSQNYAGTMFSQNLNNNLSGDLLIDTQNPLSLGHSVLAAPPPSASIAVIGGAINNPTSSSTSSPLTSLYPTIFHPVNQNFFSTSCTHSSPPGCYPYSTGLLGGTNLVNTTTPQMAASVSNLPHFLHNSNETTNFMLQSVPPAPPPSAGGGTSFLSTNFTQNTPGHLYQSCQYPTFHNLFQTNDLISSGVPSTVTCDSKPPVSNDGTCCVSTYWPLMISSEDMMMTTTTTTTPTSMVVQMSSSLTSSQTSDWNVESGMKNKVADSHIDHITSSSSNRLNYSCASLNETSAANVMRPINSPLKDTFSSLPTTANNTAANTTNHDDIVNDKSSSNASSCLPPPTTTTVILPVIRRRRRLFVHNGIKPITNIIQSPMITNDTFVNDDSSTGLMINTSVNTEVDISINAVDITATTTTSISKHYHHTDNVNTSNNDAGNIHRKNEKNELEQSNPSQFSGVPRAHLQLSTVITMNNNDTLEEDIQLSNKSSSISAESIPKLSKESFPEVIEEKDPMNSDIIIVKTPCSSASLLLSSSLSSSSCASFVNSSTTTMPASSSSKITFSSIADAQNAFNAANDSSDDGSNNINSNIGVLSPTSLPCSPQKTKLVDDNELSGENTDGVHNADIGHQTNELEKLEATNLVYSKPVESSIDMQRTPVITAASGVNTTTTSTLYPKLKSTVPFQFPPPPVLIGLDDRRILTHYIDGHIIYESDKPFPVRNGMSVIEAALSKRLSCQTKSSLSPETSLVNGYADGNHDNTKQSSSPCSPLFSTIVTSKSICDQKNPLKVSNAFSMDGDKLIQQMGSKKLPNLTRMSNYQTQRGSSVDLSNDTHDENYSSTTSCRSTQGILSSYPHSTILSLANRHSASVVYSQSPIVSIPEQNSSIAHGFDQSVDGKMDKFTCENRSHYSSSVAQSLYCESLMPMNSSNKPLNEIQSCTGTIVVSMVNAVNQSACQPRLNISQTMLNVSQQSCTTSSRLTPTTPPPPPPKGPVYKWTPDDVVAFVRGTPGCGAYASAFLNNEIDGEALLLLAEDQFIQPPIGMKIGPALKLVARLESLRHCC